MREKEFIAEYHLNASRKIVFPYVSSASGLEEWFADKVRIDRDKNYIFTYDDRDHFARPTLLKQSLHIRWDFFDPKEPSNLEEAYIEFMIEENDLTQSLFLKIIDTTQEYSSQDMGGVWEGMIGKLKTIIGG
ncbi:MAG: ATPase [Bacteroidetes bacterium]|nr:ATPase [Bacteroidota bacterium]